MEEDGNQTRLQLTSVEEGLHAHLDDISQRLDALRQPNAAATSALAAPGDLQLMARVQKAFKVARMNAILKECKVERQPGMKMADKAALIVEKVPRDRLLNFLENPAEDAPAKKKSRTEPIVLPSGASTSLARYFHNTAASPDAEGQLETTLAANACPSLGDLYEKHVLSSGASASTTATCEPLSPISSERSRFVGRASVHSLVAEAFCRHVALNATCSRSAAPSQAEGKRAESCCLVRSSRTR